MRAAAELATLNATVPLPVPETPELIVIHEALLVTVHGHAEPVVIAIVPDPPSAAIVCVGWERLNVQPA